jgi:hypothetical protein
MGCWKLLPLRHVTETSLTLSDNVESGILYVSARPCYEVNVLRGRDDVKR